MVSSLTSTTFANTTSIGLGGLTFTEAAETIVPNASMTLIGSGVSGTITTPAPTSFGFSHSGNNTALSATAMGGAVIEPNALKYTVSSVTLNKVTVTSVGGTADTVPNGWTAAANLPVDVNSEAGLNLTSGASETVLTASNGFFANAVISEAAQYGEQPIRRTSSPSAASRG